jgi:hypothetical protein
VRYHRPGILGVAATDLSRIGIYYAAARSARAVHTIVLASDGRNSAAPEVISHAIDRASQLVAIRPVAGPADAGVAVAHIDRNGRRTTLIRFQLNHDWPRRYVLASAHRLEEGSRLELVVAPSQFGVWDTLIGGSSAGPAGPVRIALETVR